MKRREFLLSAGAVAALPSIARGTAGDVRVDNVILIISDSNRRDNLSCYGPTRVQTPHLDGFAAQSIIFESAFTSSFPTVLLRNDILTGRYTFTYKDWAPIGADEVTLQETLGKAGILTALVADTPHPFAPGYNYQRGFSCWQVIRGQEIDNYRSAPRKVKLPCSPGKLEDVGSVTQYLRNVAPRRREEDYFPAQTMRAAADWLAENHDGRRFFLYVDTFDPHEPWDPPRYYVDLYDRGYNGEKVIYPRYDLWRDFLSESELNHCRAMYSGEVTMVDRWIGFLLDRIESLGLMKNTAIFFLSDHGFYFGEHGYIGKGLMRGNIFQWLPLYSQLSRLPLLAYIPGAKGGTRMRALAQPVDLMPTVLELLGVAQPATVRSRSFVPLLSGKQAKIKDLAIASPSILENPKSPPSQSNRSSITDGEWLLVFGPQRDATQGVTRTAAINSIIREVRLIQKDFRPELFHLPSDPGCDRNLFGEKRGKALELHSAYLEFLREQKYPDSRLEYFREI